MTQTQTFYYHFQKNWFWLLSNLLMLALLVSCALRHPALWLWPQMQILLGLFTLTLLMWGYKYLLKIPVAFVSNEGIKIDHSRLLPWQDIAAAEYRTARCCFRRLPLIVLLPRPGIKYRYNFIQRHIIDSDFTAFSLPLYHITAEDAAALTQIITKRVGKIRPEK